MSRGSPAAWHRLPFKGLTCFYSHPSVPGGEAPIKAAVCTHWLPEAARTRRVSELSPRHSAGLCPRHSDAAGGSSSHPRCPGRGFGAAGFGSAGGRRGGCQEVRALTKSLGVRKITSAKGLPCQKAVLGPGEGLSAQPGCTDQARGAGGSRLGVQIAAGPCWWLTLSHYHFISVLCLCPRNGCIPSPPRVPCPMGQEFGMVKRVTRL